MDALFRRKKDDLEAIDICEVESVGLCRDDAGGPGVCEGVVAGRDILSEQRRIYI
jgi:hypothetical protein